MKEPAKDPVGLGGYIFEFFPQEFENRGVVLWPGI